MLNQGNQRGIRCVDKVDVRGVAFSGGVRKQSACELFEVRRELVRNDRGVRWLKGLSEFLDCDTTVLRDFRTILQ